MELMHQRFGKDLHGCVVTVPNTNLPEQLLFVYDGDLQAPIQGEGDEEVITICQHFTLYPSIEMPAAVFEQLYEQFLAYCLPCNHDQEGGPGPLHQ
jgi:hypothetical protein